MKKICFWLLLTFVFGACSTPKKTPAKPATTITRTDIANGGTSFSNAVQIRVTNERDGRDEQYRWLKNLYPGYSLIRKSHVKRDSRHYEIFRIRTREGHLKDIYFDSTSFYGKVGR